MLAEDGGAAECVESAIVSRENAAHFAFSLSRTDDFVYAPSSRYVNVLNAFCDGSHTNAPLVLVCPPGIGKSALLAHWVSERRQIENASRECIFEHYSGCSYDSIKLSLFLFRLMTQIKAFFGLRDFELPQEHQEEKLKFSLARCLDAAVARPTSNEAMPSKMRRIIIVLDGVDCIRTEDGGDSLSWLPTSFPIGVKIIVSTALVSSTLQPCAAISRKQALPEDEVELDDDTPLPRQAHESHTIRELRRRNARFLVVEPLDESSCRAILTAYESTSGLVLTPDEIDTLVQAPLSSSPLCVRLVLHGLTLFDEDQRQRRREWLSQALKATSLPAVYAVLLQRWNQVLLTGVSNEIARLHAAIEASSGMAQHVDDPRSSTRRRSSISVSSFPTISSDPIATAAEIETLQATIGQRALLVRHALSLLSVARYGLSEGDLLRLIGDSVPRASVRMLLRLLGPQLLRMRRSDCGEALTLYSLSHNQLRLLVRHAFLRDEDMRMSYYRELATYFNGLDACQRRLDELPVQLERCHQWTALQSALVDIAMFQLWWSAHNRQQLYAYWHVLRANGALHDPVDDLMRSLEEHVVRSNPSAEQLLRLLLSITEFLRAWQRIDGADKDKDKEKDKRAQGAALHRPDPPQLPQFLTSVGCGSTAHLPETQAQQVQDEIDALSIHVDDSYSVRRWLWTQFPLVGIAFETRFLRQLLPAKTAGTNAAAAATSSPAAAAATSSAVLPSSVMPPNSVTASPSLGSANPPSVLLPKTLGSLTEASPSPSRAPPRRSPDADTSAPDDFGAFEFLSTNHSELPLGSVSKMETRLMTLHAQLDRLMFAQSERQKVLDAVSSRLAMAKASAHAAGESAEQIELLQDQIRAVSEETQVGRQRSDYYKAILRHCEINPARDPNTIDAAEAAVHKMHRDVRALQQQTQVISFETRLATTELHNMTQVVAERATIHQTALSRLRWRKELTERLRRTPRLWDAWPPDASDSAAPSAPEDDDMASTEDDSSSRGMDAREDNNPTPTEDEDDAHALIGLEGTVNFARAKDRLVHKKETALARMRRIESLQVYIGSPFKDDGVLGALRQVGLNRPEEAQRFWLDQIAHAAQLEAEERNAEQAVADARERLEQLQAQFVNLKLGGGPAASDELELIGASPEPETRAGSPHSLSVRSALTSAAGLVSQRDVAPNLKTVDKKQQLAEVSAAAQHKKERVVRAKALSEKLQLGLLHVAQILGVNAASDMDALELADAVEQVVRLYLGDEGHLQTTSSNNLRRKNSVRTTGIASQTGLSAYVAPDTRSLEDRIRFNIRVSTSPHRQVNPYARAGSASTSAREDSIDGDDEDDAAEMPIATRADRIEREMVSKRSDIKSHARQEVEKRQAVQKRAGKKSEPAVSYSEKDKE